MVFLFPHTIVDSFQIPLFLSPPKIVVFSPFIVLSFPTIIVESFQIFSILFFFPQMRSAFSQLLLLVSAFSVLVVENFPSRWMTPC